MARKKIRKTYSLSRDVAEYLETKADSYEASFEVEEAVRASEGFKDFIKEMKNETND